MEYSVINADGVSYIGERIAGGSVFRGIKYATAARFELPKTVVPAGNVDATRFGDCCPQKRTYFDEKFAKNTFYYDEFRRGSEFGYSEDCLNLNVYTPLFLGGEVESVNASSSVNESGGSGEKAPVILFVHGGSFTGGSSDEKQLDGSAYLSRGVVFVSVNYRLNVFGFYAGSGASGNYGLYDVACALEFVRRNIACFGGDPDNITLMGQSAGAMLITTLIASGMAEGKVRRAIMLSGGGIRKLLMPLRHPDRKFWDGIKKDVEGFGTMIDSAKAEVLFKVWMTHGGIRSLFATAPTIDGSGVKDNDYAAHTVPCIIGMVGKDLLPPVLKKMRYRYAKLLAEQGKGCYAYDFLHPLPGDSRGTFHSADLWYALGSLKNSSRPFGTADRAISDAMLDRFSAFIHTDSPNPTGYKTWHLYKEDGDILRLL